MGSRFARPVWPFEVDILTLTSATSGSLAGATQIAKLLTVRQPTLVCTPSL